MQEHVIVSHRGARFEIGRGPGFYGIWPAGATQWQPIEWWPETAEGWKGAWARFTDVEPRRAIQPAGQAAGLSAALRRAGRPAVLAAALIAAGIAIGIVGLFPGYFSSAGLADQAEQLVPHLIYLVAWAAGAVLVLAGGARQKIGALLAAGVSLVTFGFFLADLGTGISSGDVGAGLVLSLIGWAACTAGSVLAVRLAAVGAPARPRTLETVLTLALAAAAAVGTAIAFAPSWDTFTLRTAAGTSQRITAGYAFANPGPVIAGDVAVMVAIVAVVLVAASWRSIRLGAALLAGAIIPMAAQAISAVIQVGHATSSLQFGIPPAQAARVGLTITAGLTPAFWIYCAFVAALVLTAALMASAPAPPPPPPSPVPARPGQPGLMSPPAPAAG